MFHVQIDGKTGKHSVNAYKMFNLKDGLCFSSSLFDQKLHLYHTSTTHSMFKYVVRKNKEYILVSGAGAEIP